jgi:hypothetical protein
LKRRLFRHTGVISRAVKNVKVELDEKKAIFKVFSLKNVVENVEDESSEISLEDAKKKIKRMNREIRLK